MAFKITRVKFKKGRKYITHTTRFGKNSKYNTKRWRYNGNLIKL